MPYRAIVSACSAALILGLLFSMPSPARAGVRDVFAIAPTDRVTTGDVFLMGFDAVVIRPVSAARMVAGAALFAPVSLITLIGGVDNARDGFNLLVAEPARYAFTRPLGEL